MVPGSLGRKRKEKNALDDKEISDLVEIYTIGRCQYIPTLALLFDVSEVYIYRILRRKAPRGGLPTVSVEELSRALLKCQSTNTDA